MSPIYDVDVRDLTRRVVRVGLVGGLCEFTLGAAVMQFSAYDCDLQSGQRALDRRMRLDPSLPYT